MNKAEKSLRWVVNQIPDFKPTTNEKKMLVAIKLYSEAGAEEINRLEAENAALRERLGKAVELPCKVGDSAYYIQNGKIYYGTVVCLCFDSSSVNKIGVELPSLGISEYMPSSRCIEKREVGKTLFFTIAEAKSRLAELKGRKE